MHGTCMDYGLTQFLTRTHKTLTFPFTEWRCIKFSLLNSELHVSLTALIHANCSNNYFCYRLLKHDTIRPINHKSKIYYKDTNWLYCLQIEWQQIIMSRIFNLNLKWISYCFGILTSLTVQRARCSNLPSFSKDSNFWRSLCESIRHIGKES
jgi:hypothetical protein